MQGVLGRGGSELAEVILAAYQAGCRFDGWSEEFEPDKWFAAFEQNSIDLSEQLKPIPFEAPLPWSLIEKGVSIEHLQKERHRTSFESKTYRPKTQETASDEHLATHHVQFGRGKKKVASRNLTAPTKNRVRIRWGKDARYKYMSHLDNIRFLERAFRRARIPVAFSQGFNPTMKLSFGPPLPLGFTSESEFVDITLEGNLLPYMVEAVRQALAEGMHVYEARIVLGKAPSLSSMLNRVVYTLPLEDICEKADLSNKVMGILQANALPVERVGKSKTTTVNVRPAIFDIRIDADLLVMTLGIGEGGYVRPTEVLGVLDFRDSSLLSHSFHRKKMYRQDNTGREIDAMDI
jgi:radical SAM-linked protein